MLWLGPLIAAEVLAPRPRYDVRRWATVFPLGMYAACSFAVGHSTGITGIGTFARVQTWLALAVSLFVFAGLIRRSWRVLLPGAAG
jgi:tellurite resistance protein TehA-like permease